MPEQALVVNLGYSIRIAEDTQFISDWFPIELDLVHHACSPLEGYSSDLAISYRNITKGIQFDPETFQVPISIMNEPTAGVLTKTVIQFAPFGPTREQKKNVRTFCVTRRCGNGPHRPAHRFIDGSTIDPHLGPSRDVTASISAVVYGEIAIVEVSGDCLLVRDVFSARVRTTPRGNFERYIVTLTASVSPYSDISFGGRQRRSDSLFLRKQLFRRSILQSVGLFFSSPGALFSW
ncbi:hypothetical protein EVAR_2713_1 [Eumeta japonica]|uniref:Uncharacterized protein n=1 Tax=Eumeta variegata TaxID=151549 RepID=A0A4C1SMU9_EUMVA|nr:hypothetical protein EVAR_2713_1 [Eumeta japonica]